MIRALVAAAAYVVLWVYAPDQHAGVLRFVTVLEWVLPALFLREVNAALNRWAENRWMWTDGKSAWQWSSELAVVTGGSKGIGAAVAKKLVSHGIRVAVLDVEPLSNEFQPDEEKLVTFYRCDITSRQAVHEAAEVIRSDYGSPSILINNAGIGNANTIFESTPERLRAIFDVNLISHWYTVQEFLPDMIAKKKGHIMSTASLAAFVGLAGMVDYSCTKAGLIAFYEGLTQELKHRYNAPQVQTSIVYPLWVRTRLTQHVAANIKKSGASMMEPEDVAEAMVRQILAAKSGQIVLGPAGAASVRALPVWIQELIRDREARIVTMNATTAVA